MSSNNYYFKGSTVLGEWRVDKNEFGAPCVVQYDSSGWVVGVSYVVEELGQSHFAEQDAHLIAAAPALLTACVKALDFLETLGKGALIQCELEQTIRKALNIPYS